jgi:hypothetical protein
MVRTTKFRRAATVAGVVLAIWFESAAAQTSVKTGFNLFSAEQDVEIGRQSADPSFPTRSRSSTRRTSMRSLFREVRPTSRAV